MVITCQTICVLRKATAGFLFILKSLFLNLIVTCSTVGYISSVLSGPLIPEVSCIIGNVPIYSCPFPTSHLPQWMMENYKMIEKVNATGDKPGE